MVRIGCQGISYCNHLTPMKDNIANYPGFNAVDVADHAFVKGFVSGMRVSGIAQP